jgi:WD40 repeat protein
MVLWGSAIISGGMDKKLAYWDVMTGKNLDSVETPAEVLVIIKTLLDDHFAVGLANGTILLVREYNIIKTFDDAHSGSVVSIDQVVSQEDNGKSIPMLVTASDGGEINLINLGGLLS